MAVGRGGGKGSDTDPVSALYSFTSLYGNVTDHEPKIKVKLHCNA